MIPTHTLPGVSAIALYTPPLRVRLEDWCRWTGASWDKVQAVVGRSFRMPGPRESVYTLAASAVLRLIQQNDIDPSRVGLLALGTESSTDTSAGAVIVRGMVDQALDALGLPRLASDCEVPEFKHACLGGVYALKAATRYAACDGADRAAIVVSVDIAEYARGSSGEQTQGAGAVAMLVEREPRLFSIDLARAGSASNYRGPDFRKPLRRFHMDGYDESSRLHDYPVFNGRYSTFCYVDAVMRATRAMLRRTDATPSAVLERSDALFFHRPYHHMPIQAAATLLLLAIADDEPDALAGLCAEASVDVDDVRAELAAPPRLFTPLDPESVAVDPRPNLSRVARVLRKTPRFKAFVAEKMHLGSEHMMDLGNMYTAALPAWLAAGFEDALERDVDLSGATLLAVGYGSGDAAEAIPLYVAPGWREAAARIGLRRALEHPVDLTQGQYERLHDTGEADAAPTTPFAIQRIGDTYRPDFQDIGLEYYGFTEVSSR